MDGILTVQVGYYELVQVIAVHVHGAYIDPIVLDVSADSGTARSAPTYVRGVELHDLHPDPIIARSPHRNYVLPCAFLEMTGGHVAEGRLFSAGESAAFGVGNHRVWRKRLIEEVVGVNLRMRLVSHLWRIMP